MLTLIKLIRNLFKQLKSDLTPTQIAVGVFFGAVAGLTPFGLHLLLLFTLALLVNCSMAACLLVFGALKPIGLALGGASFRTGASLLENGDGAFASIIRGVSSAPILAYLGFDLSHEEVLRLTLRQVGDALQLGHTLAGEVFGQLTHLFAAMDLDRPKRKLFRRGR